MDQHACMYHNVINWLIKIVFRIYISIILEAFLLNFPSYVCASSSKPEFNNSLVYQQYGFVWQ
jgi:hypothetical protein